MSDNTATNLNTDTTVTTPVVAVKPKSNRGAKKNPNSKVAKARVLLANLPADVRLPKDVSRQAVEMLMKELGLSKEVANVYFYNERPGGIKSRTA
jgi:hypothetical protein